MQNPQWWSVIVSINHSISTRLRTRSLVGYRAKSKVSREGLKKWKVAGSFTRTVLGSLCPHILFCFLNLAGCCNTTMYYSKLWNCVALFKTTSVSNFVFYSASSWTGPLGTKLTIQKHYQRMANMAFCKQRQRGVHRHFQTCDIIILETCFSTLYFLKSR